METYDPQHADDAPHAEPAEDALAATVERASLGHSSSNFRSAKVVVDDSAGKAHVKPTWMTRLFGGIFTGIGVTVMVVGGLEAMILLIGGVFAAVGVLGLVFGFGAGATFNRRTGIVSRRRYIVSWETLPLDNLAAVQICSRWAEGSRNSRGYTAYELNIVLHDPPGERRTLMAHANGRRLREDAQNLAAFLELPVLDHAQNRGPLRGGGLFG